MWLLVVDDEAVLPFRIPLSIGGLIPHFPSDSVGSITLTDPSVDPMANWFGSNGCVATTSGYAAWLLQKFEMTKRCNHTMFMRNGRI